MFQLFNTCFNNHLYHTFDTTTFCFVYIDIYIQLSVFLKKKKPRILLYRHTHYSSLGPYFIIYIHHNEIIDMLNYESTAIHILKISGCTVLPIKHNN